MSSSVIKVSRIALAASLIYFAPKGFAQSTIATVVGTQWIFPLGTRTGLDAPFGTVKGVAVDNLGNVYVADPDNHIVARITPQNVLAVIAGNGIRGFSGDGGPAVSAQLSSPHDVAIDPAGNLYILGGSRVRKVAPTGVITTVAGGGSRGASQSDGGPATLAQLSNSSDDGLAVDSVGNIFIAEYGTSRIRKVAVDGTISTVAGNGTSGFSGDDGPARSATLASPTGVAVDSSGKVYIADNLNGRVRVVSTDGTITTLAGGGTDYNSEGIPAKNARIPQPSRLAIDGAGNVLVSEYFQRIRTIRKDGTIQTVAGSGFGFSGDGGAAIRAQLTWPRGVASDQAGNVYFADSGNERIRRVSSGGTITTIGGNSAFRFSANGSPAATAWLYNPAGLVFDRLGNLLIADATNERIRRVTRGGVFSTVAGAPAGSSGGTGLTTRFNHPSDLAFDAAGNLFIGSLQVVDSMAPDGKLTRVAGTGGCSADGFVPPDVITASQAGFCGVLAIQADARGTLYIAATFTFSDAGRLWRLGSDGKLTRIAGDGIFASPPRDGGAATLAGLKRPSGIAFDTGGNIYVADSSDHRIRRIDATSGVITTIAGTGTAGFSGDAGLAVSARLNSPEALLSDRDGNLYVLDQGNNRIRKISAQGIISTIAGNGIRGSSGDGGPALSASFNFGGGGLALDDAGNLFVSDSGNDRIREIFVSRPQLSVDSSGLQFAATRGSPAPSAQSFKAFANLTGVAITVEAATDSGGKWLLSSVDSGLTPIDVRVSVDPSNLAAGQYTGTITITAPNAVPPRIVVPVSLTIGVGLAPRLNVLTRSISFSVVQGSGSSSQQLSVLNAGEGSLPVSALASTNSGGNWLAVSPLSGVASSTQPLLFTVTAAAPASLAGGTYSGKVIVTSAASGESVSIPVTLSVRAAQQKLLLSHTGMTFTGVAQGGAPLPQSFGILNTGQGSMSWTAKTSTLSGGSWLSIDQGSGAVSTPFTDVSLVNLSINPNGLTPGDYYGQVQVTAPGAPNSPQSVSVILNVLPVGSSPGAEVRPTGLIFIGQAGNSPGSQNVMVSNPTSAPLTFGSGRFTVPSGGNWLVSLPTDATIQPNAPQQIVVQPDYSRLAPGSINRGFLNLGFLDGTSRSISVLTVVAPAGTNLANGKPGDREASGCTPTSMVVQPTALNDPSASVALSQPTTISVRMVDNCGEPVTASRGGVASISSNGDSQVTLVHVGDGNWNGTWQPRNGAAGSRVTVQFVGFLKDEHLAGTATITVTLRSGAATPLTFAALNSASGVGTFISPGGLVSIYGQQLADRDGVGGGAPFPTTLNGTQVLMGGKALPLYFVGSGQINAQVPFDLGINTQQQLTVQRGTTLSVPQDVVVAAAQPAVYTLDSSGHGPAHIYYNGATLVTPGNPVKAGDVIVLYCNGLGAVNPPVPAGTPAPAAGPLSRTVDTLKVSIGGVDARVDFAGLAPGITGVFQVNAVVPAGVTPGDAVEVVLSIAGQTSPPVTTAVR